jgi:O-antigen biosynthesis protein
VSLASGMSESVTADSREPWQHDYFSKFRPARNRNRPVRICILVGSVDISGGTYVIFQHALALAESGVDVTIVSLMPLGHAAPNWHPALGRLRLLQIESVGAEEFDVAMATWWLTVYRLPEVRARQYAYFVQSIESRFATSPGDASVTQNAARTYTFDLFTLTITSLIQTYLAVEFCRPSVIVRNGIRKDLYSPFGPQLSMRPEQGLRVLVEGPLGIPLKNTETAIEIARSVTADVWLLTSTPVGNYSGVSQLCSRIPVDLCAGIYRSCDVLLKLSRVEGMFGPPLEMFHCGGTAVVYDVTGSEEYIRHGRNALVAEMEDEEGARAALFQLLHDRPMLEGLRTGALRTAALWPDWSDASATFVDTVLTLANLPDRDHQPMLDSIRLSVPPS